jgi:hypothetical protein
MIFKNKTGVVVREATVGTSQRPFLGFSAHTVEMTKQDLDDLFNVPYDVARTFLAIIATRLEG